MTSGVKSINISRARNRALSLMEEPLNGFPIKSGMTEGDGVGNDRGNQGKIPAFAGMTRKRNNKRSWYDIPTSHLPFSILHSPFPILHFRNDKGGMN